ncbi:MAG: AgmX/PglI C-terminal domain-containing protein [Myxococcota bacterium]
MTSTPPPPPKHGGSGPFIAAAVIMLLLMGGLIYWKIGGDAPKPAPSSAPVAANTPPPLLDEPPPPPPPPEEPKDAGAEAKQQKKAVASTGGGGCGGECKGEPPASLRTILAGRGAQARRCYERALMQNNMLQGRMQVSLRIGPTGSVCSANLTQNELDPGIGNCVLGIFRSSTFPAPKGGCVDASVPLRFEPKK